MMNKMKFNDFLTSLKKTNLDLNSLTDFEKCTKNVKKLAINLYALNYLLGKKNLKEEIDLLFYENKKCFSSLNILVAIRDKHKEILYNDEVLEISSLFENTDQIYDFMLQTGLAEIFQNGNITNLYDYVFGIEVGLDSNARKNRSGNVMETTLKNLFKSYKLNFQEQVNIYNIPNLSLGDDIKKFDFAINGKNKKYLIECNFYSTGSSKLNETARSYIEISEKISKFDGFSFVWITDGQGWLDAKTKLSEAYKSVQIYNLSNINNFIKEIE